MKNRIKIYCPLWSEGSGRGGFTLVELMIAMALGLIVLGAMYGVFNTQSKQFSNQEQIVEMQQNARMAIDILSREIRMAGYDPTDPSRKNVFTFKYTDTEERKTDHQSVAFTSDYSEGGAQNYNDNEQIAFRVEGGVLKRFSTGAVHWQPLVENIEVLEFTYTVENGDGTVTVVAPPSDPTAAQVLNIVKVRIKVTAKAAKADPAYTDPTNNDHYRRYTLMASVTPRNL